MKNSTKPFSRNSFLARALLQSLEPRTLLSASITARVDLSGYDPLIQANLDGQPGFELVAFKDNLATVINDRTNTVQTFIFPLGSTPHIANALLQTNAPPAELYATNGNLFTSLDVATGTMHTFNVGASTHMAIQDLDGQSGFEYIFYDGPSSLINVVNPTLNTITRFNVGPFDTLNIANLDGHSGMDIYTTAGSTINIINPNTQFINTFHLPSAVDLEPATISTPPLQSQIIPAPDLVPPVTEDLITVNSSTYTITSLSSNQTTSFAFGNTALFVVNMDGQSNSELVALNGSSASIINDRLITLRNINFSAASTAHLALNPITSPSQITTGTEGLLFSTNASSITTANPTNGLMKTFNISPWTLLLTTDGGAAGSQIVAASSTILTIINPSNSTFRKFSTPAITNLNVADLDGIAGDEIYLSTASSITIINTRLQTLRTFNVGPFTTARTADLDGIGGNEIFTYTLGGNAITVLNVRKASFKTYRIATYNSIDFNNLDGQPGNEISAIGNNTVTIINPRLQTFKTFNTNTNNTTPFVGPVGALPGQQLILLAPTFVTLISAATGTFKTYAVGTADSQTVDNVGLPALSELITTHNSTITFRNLANNSLSNLDAGLLNPALHFLDLDGKPGDEIYYMNGSVLTIIKPV